MIHTGRHTATLEGDFVVFLLGARINRMWKLGAWLPVARAMTRMQREISGHPEIGCLHIESFNGRTTLSLQYWRSFDHLERFARSPEWSHLEAWRDFNRLIRDSGDVGVWHETYRVAAGQYEAIYASMPVFGLAGAGSHASLSPSSTSATRIGRRGRDRAPVEAY
ncbi:MAG: DUF4188 domain-containing protein [Actinomycetota bacterium]